MSWLRFEWDDRKATTNRRKHKVSFEEAVTAFADDRALLIGDPEHSDEEDRFLLLGISADLQTLVVCHCYEESRDVVRIISARRANRKERRQYAERWRT
jgi:uncharacterized protein